MELYADSARGVYIPQFFAETVRRELVRNVTPEQFDILLAGPNHTYYWDTWNDVECQAEIHAPDGKVFTLWQNGDLWLIERGEEIPDDFRW